MLRNCCIKSLFKGTLFEQNRNGFSYVNKASRESGLINSNRQNFAKKFNSDCKYSLEEILIPNGTNKSIACKVWKGENRDSDVKSETPIICVHGWLDNANSFDALLPKLIRPNRTFYAFDLPGHGLSSHTEGTHYNSHTETHLSIHRLVRHLKFQKISLIGHSMGAEGCTMFAATHPQYVEKLVTIDGVNPQLPDWVHWVKIFADSIFEVEEAILKGSQKESTYEELLARIIKARVGVVTEEGCRILLERGVVKLPSGKYIFSHDIKLRIPPGMSLIETSQMTEFCTGIEAPICVIKGTETDPFSDQASKDFVIAMEAAKKECGEEMNVEFHRVEGTHHVHLNDPDKVAPIIAKFLDS